MADLSAHPQARSATQGWPLLPFLVALLACRATHSADPAPTRRQSTAVRADRATALTFTAVRPVAATPPQPPRVEAVATHADAIRLRTPAPAAPAPVVSTCGVHGYDGNDM